MTIRDLLLPIAHAQAAASTQGGKTFAQIVDGTIAPFGDLVVQLIFLIAFLAFLYGVVKYFLMNRSEEARSQGRQFMLYGLIGLVVLFSVWGLVKILLSVLTDWSK